MKDLDLMSRSRGSTCTEARRRRASGGEVDGGGVERTQSPFVQGEGLARYDKYYISKCTVTKQRLTWPDTTRGRDEGQGKLKCYYIYMSGRTP